MRTMYRLHKAAKDFCRRWITRNDAILHVYAGLFVWIVIAVAIGNAASIIPLLSAFIVEIANEVFDRWRTGSWRWNETVPDFIHSMLWPVALFIAARSGYLR